jgi:hypothetical protein
MNSKTRPYQLIFVNRPQVQFLPRWIGQQAISRWSATQRQNITADQIAANQLSPIDNHPSNSETRIDNEPK